MTIEEYHKIRAALFNATPEEKEFFRNVCRSAGHEWFKDPNEFADVCTRCEEKKSWMNPSALSKIGSSMVAPLKAKLDYKEIGRKFIETEKLEQGDLPIYDKDIDLDNPEFK